MCVCILYLCNHNLNQQFFIINCHQLSSIVINCHQLSSIVINCFNSHQAGSEFLIKWIANKNGQWDLVTGYCGSPWEQTCPKVDFLVTKTDQTVFWGLWSDQTNTNIQKGKLTISNNNKIYNVPSNFPPKMGVSGTPTVPSYKVPKAVLVGNSFNQKFASSLLSHGK